MTFIFYLLSPLRFRLFLDGETIVSLVFLMMHSSIALIYKGRRMNKILAVARTGKPVLLKRICLFSFVISRQFMVIFLKLFCLFSEHSFFRVIFLNTLICRFFLYKIG